MSIPFLQVKHHWKRRIANQVFLSLTGITVNYPSIHQTQRSGQYMRQNEVIQATKNKKRCLVLIKPLSLISYHLFLQQWPSTSIT